MMQHAEIVLRVELENYSQSEISTRRRRTVKTVVYVLHPTSHRRGTVGPSGQGIQRTLVARRINFKNLSLPERQKFRPGSRCSRDCRPNQESAQPEENRKIVQHGFVAQDVHFVHHTQPEAASIAGRGIVHSSAVIAQHLPHWIRTIGSGEGVKDRVVIRRVDDGGGETGENNDRNYLG